MRFLWPVINKRREVNHPFGEVRSYGLHEGVDLYAKTGDGVIAAAGGVVVWASDQRMSGGDSAYGSHIVIKHEGKYITWYCHLYDMISAVGDVVEAGDVIGYAGSTGNSTGPHLHFNVQHIGHGLDGFVLADVVDPEPLLIKEFDYG